MRWTNAKLKEYVKRRVKVTFTDGKTESGALGYTERFSSEYGFRKPGYFTINNLDFKVSHIDKIEILP